MIDLKMTVDLTHTHIIWNQKGSKLWATFFDYKELVQVYIYGESVWNSFHEFANVWINLEKPDTFSNDFVNMIEKTYTENTNKFLSLGAN